jgi:hypothetical protein
MGSGSWGLDGLTPSELDFLPPAGQHTRHKPKRQRKAKPRPRWAPTVDLPSATSGGPALVCNEAGRTVRLDHLNWVDLDALLPARRFAGAATRRNKPGRPTLERLGEQYAVESEAEAIGAHLADRDPTVRLLIPQPFWLRRRIDYPDDRQRHAWVCPDFLVVHDNGDLVTVEVKRWGFELNAASARKFESVAAACNNAGSRYVLRPGLDTRQRQLFYLLHQHRRTRLLPTPQVEPIRARVLAVAAGSTTLEELWALGDTYVMKPVVWWMLWHQDLCLDWRERIGPRTAVRVHGALCQLAAGTSAWDFKCGPSEQTLIDAAPTSRQRARRAPTDGSTP